MFPPADVADADRIPGFVGVLGSNGPIGFSTAVSIEDRGEHRILVHARGPAIDLDLAFAVERTVRTAMSMTGSGSGTPFDFLQLGGEYRVTGHVGDRVLDFRARGAAETFRPH